MKNRKLRVQVYVYIVGITVLLILFTGFLASVIARKALMENAYTAQLDSLEQTRIYIENILKEIEKSFSSVENMDAFVRIVEGDYKSEINNYYKDICSVTERFSEICQEDSYVDSIYFCNGDGLELYKTNIGGCRRINGEELLKNSKNTWEHIWLDPHRETIFDTRKERQVVSVMGYYGNKDEGSSYLIFNIITEEFLEVMNNIEMSQVGYLMLQGDQNILYSRGIQEKYKMDSSTLQKLKSRDTEEGWVRTRSTEGNSLMCSTVVFAENGWKLTAVIPEKSIVEDVNQIGHSVAGIILAAIFICMLLAAVISGAVTKPLAEVVQKVETFKNENLQIQFEEKGSYEITVLTQALNHFVDRIHNLLEEVREKEKIKRKSELAVIQEEINPHFLYNTLTSLRGLIDTESKEKAIYMLDQLTEFFRTSIGAGREEVSVEEELRHVESYLKIQKLRYESILEYEIACEEKVKGQKILKLILQPIVENALYHGIKECGGGMILINAEQKENFLEISVLDDGVGIEAEKLEEIKKVINIEFQDEDITRFFGMRNVNQRLKLYYGDEYGLQIESAEGEFTVVKIRIPLKEQKEM